METKSKKPIWILFLFTFGYLTENNGFPLTRQTLKRPHTVFIRLCAIIVMLLTKKKIMLINTSFVCYSDYADSILLLGLHSVHTLLHKATVQ